MTCVCVTERNVGPACLGHRWDAIHRGPSPQHAGRARTDATKTFCVSSFILFLASSFDSSLFATLLLTEMSSGDVLYRVEVGEGTPLVQEPLPEIPEGSTSKEKIVTALAGLGFGTNLLLVLFSSQASVFWSGIFGMLLAPYALFQQRKLVQVRVLAETNVRMQDEVGRLQVENTRLQHQEEELGTSASQ